MRELKVLNISGRAVPVRGDDIDTDRIFPARFMKEITFASAGERAFYDVRFNADGSRKDHPFNEARFRGAAILLANANFGCGSSREHAPQALARCGIRAIVAESYGEIFAGNCAMLGIAAVTAERADIARLQAQAECASGAMLTIDLETMRAGAQGIVVPVTMPAAHRQALTSGEWDVTGLMLGNAAQVQQADARLRRTFQ